MPDVRFLSDPMLDVDWAYAGDLVQRLAVNMPDQPRDEARTEPADFQPMHNA